MIIQEPLPLSAGNRISILNSNRSIQPDTFSFQRSASRLYESSDPRLFDSPRAMHLYLDQPPLQSSGTQPQQNVNCIGDQNQCGYYPSYSSIYGGDITYYTDLDTDGPLDTPSFQNPSMIHPTILVDPMGSIKPYYRREPLFQQQSGLYDYSFDQDQCEFREDLMALQQSKINRSNFCYHLFHQPDLYYPSFSNTYRPFSS